MSGRFNSIDAELLLALQRGLPLQPKPFAGVGAALGLTEDTVLEKTAAFVRAGLVRRFGAVFNARGLGYESTLCAVNVPEADLAPIAARVDPHPGITHCYQRSGTPALWFTLTAPVNEFGREIETVARRIRPYELLNLPTRRTFKIGVILDVRRNVDAPASSAPDDRGQGALTPPPAGRPSARVFNERERQLVRKLQRDLALVGDPFAAVARELNFEHNELLELLRDWQRNGILRRVGLIPHHRELGFAVNGMCVWKVAAQDLEAAGRIVALSPQVTHCYCREMHPKFPFNLYAMLHAHDQAEAQKLRERLAAAAGLSGGQMLVSLREFKKSSPQFFMPPINDP
ncbi:MAG: hypothetical protein HYV36_02975 [Lentisphaerae bacterium]|nr:hypothetical protein [Lentisphaerota bacterium]